MVWFNVKQSYKVLSTMPGTNKYPMNASYNFTSHSLLCWGVVPIFLVEKVSSEKHKHLPKDSVTKQHSQKAAVS